MMCGKCKKVSGILFVALGIALLLRDFNVWTFWNIQWYSALIALWGLGNVCASMCGDCTKMCK